MVGRARFRGTADSVPVRRTRRHSPVWRRPRLPARQTAARAGSATKCWCSRSGSPRHGRRRLRPGGRAGARRGDGAEAGAIPRSFRSWSTTASRFRSGEEPHGPALAAPGSEARDPGCRFPGCGNRRFLDAHHIRHWARGGETRLDNLVPLVRTSPPRRPRGRLLGRGACRQ